MLNLEHSKFKMIQFRARKLDNVKFTLRKMFLRIEEIKKDLKYFIFFNFFNFGSFQFEIRVVKNF